MSKSRGNVITVDEVVFGVLDLDQEYEFRYKNGHVIADYKELGIWRDKLGSGMFFTGTRFGKQPIYLHFKNNPEPALLSIDGDEVIQHGNVA